MARSREGWRDRTIGEYVYLVLGWRQGKRLLAGRLALSATMDTPLRQRAQNALATIGQREPRKYEPTAQLEEDEVFLLTVEELPTLLPSLQTSYLQMQNRGEEEEGEHVEASAIIALLAAPGELEPLSPDNVRGKSFLFYAVVFEGPNGKPIAFVKHHNAATVAKPGRLLGLFGQTVTKIDDPVLVLERDFDLVLDGQEIAALMPSAISSIFADLEVVAAGVPTYVKQLRDLQLPLSEETCDALRSVCGKRRLLAKRLRNLLSAEYLTDLTLQDVRQYLSQTGQDPAPYIRGDEFVVAEEHISAFLEVLAQVHYLGGYDHRLRRADRSSIVQPA